jgi:hypothetical protein
VKDLGPLPGWRLAPSDFRVQLSGAPSNNQSSEPTSHPAVMGPVRPVQLRLGARIAHFAAQQSLRRSMDPLAFAKAWLARLTFVRELGVFSSTCFLPRNGCVR